MFTIMDYLKFYNNTSFDDVRWNTLDNLIGAILVYLPISSFNENKNLKELYNYVSSSTLVSSNFMATKAIEILNIIKDSKRYNEIIISDFNNIKNDEVQFGACVIKTKKEKIISFKGTDSSLIGWLENFRLAYEYPTYTQKLAIDYLKNNISFLDQDVYVVGHSKGGNLAMASTMELTDSKFSKIREVCNFDGPGFKKEEYESNKYKRLNQKLLNIIPTGSVVGTLLYNDNYKVVSSNEIVFEEHYPTSWKVFGQYFIEGKLSDISRQFHKNASAGLETLDKEKLKKTIETGFKSFEKEYSSNFKLNFNDIKTFYTNMKNVDPEIRNYIDVIMDELIRIF